MSDAATLQNVTPGVHDAMPRSLYEAMADESDRQLVHYSMLKLFSMPPAKAKYKIDLPPEPTDALNLGDGCHAAVFEPERFEAEFVRAPKMTRRTNAAKAEWATFISETQEAGKVPLPPEDYDKALAIRDALWTRESVVRSILSQPGKVERSFVWRDPVTEMLCKARVDWMCRWHGWTIVLDLKTTDIAAEWRFKYAIRKYHYAKQAAFYLDGLDVLHKMPRRWLWLAVEKEPPYLAAIYEPTPTMLASARNTYRAWMETLKACRETGIWPGYHDSIISIDDFPSRNGDE